MRLGPGRVAPIRGPGSREWRPAGARAGSRAATRRGAAGEVPPRRPPGRCPGRKRRGRGRCPAHGSPAMELGPPAAAFCAPHEPPGEDWPRSGAAGEDPWKKFEALLPSPPPSPLPGLAAADDGLPEPGGLPGNRGAVVLRDCMWSGLSGRERCGRAPGEPLEAGLGGRCVAPGAVFAWPAGGATAADSKIRASSGSDSQSDSEGEEIDVVTVEKRQALSVRKPVTITVRAAPSDPCTKHFHLSIHQQQHNYAARSPSEVRPQEGPLEKGTQRDAEEEEEGSGADAHSNGSAQSLGRVVESFSLEPVLPKAGSAPSSDTEDVSKRRNHNYLERKRRNDLRSRFLALRDQVPGLAACPKTPKVVILSKASEYLQSLLSAEQQMVAEKQLLKLHRLQLLKQISHLKGVR
ncbi:protein L-Myc [Varanus komodoensis]|uniref:protein L-Myc n=1 Tax=Varanus komodoensis TaxID=61221 RepID=UPI001CF7A8DB|nr:protein L-Myc [Varanus komodoensis]